MKYFLLLFLLNSFICNSQEIKIIQIKELNIKDSGVFMVSGFSSDGQEILITRAKYKGLYLYNINKKNIKIISESDGAGYEPIFSNNAKTIVYRTNTFCNHKKSSSLISFEISTGDTSTIEKEKRVISQPVYSGNSLNFISNGILKSQIISSTKMLSQISDTLLLTDEFSPILVINGIKHSLKPGGEGQYIWVSLSPDKTKMLYHLVGQGTFISDLKGNNISSLGKFNAPKWLNNKIVIGMDDKDNGYYTTSSELIAYYLTTNKKITITSTPGIAEMYPYASPDGKSIAFSTSDGKLYLMKIEIKN